MIDQHRRLLADTGRNLAYAEAIKRLVRPGKSRVADLGTGTGLLALLAEKAGAASVWACDGDAGIVGLAKQVAAANGAKRIRFASGHSSTLAPPQPVDVLVSEILGNIAWEEHMVESLRDARRWLAPGGVMLPCAVEQHICPVVDGELQSALDIFDQIVPGMELDYRAPRRVSLSNCFVRTLPASALLEGGAAAVRLERLEFPGNHKSQRSMPAAWTFAKPTTVHGLCLWWSADLVPGITISTSPLAEPTHWEQIYLPLMTPLDVRSGDRVELTLTMDTRWEAGCVVTWAGSQVRRGKPVASFRTCNKDGFLRG